jgi:hypothetical protein
VNASGQTQGVTVRRFDILPGTLDSVLPVFEKTAQLHVTVPRDSMRGIWSPGVAGLYTPQAALQKLLTGTGIGYHLTGPDEVVLAVIASAGAALLVFTGLSLGVRRVRASTGRRVKVLATTGSRQPSCSSLVFGLFVRFLFSLRLPPLLQCLAL